MGLENDEQILNNEKRIQRIDEEQSRPWTGRILFILFGLGSWLNLNGIWIELPLLIPRLPEGWDLSPQLGMASNLANVGPLLIALIRSLSKGSSRYEVPSICLIFAVGILVPLLLSFTWMERIFFFGQFRSLYLLIFGFFLALVNCTSSVTYLPFVNRFHPKWLNWYFIGEAFSSLLPALLGLIQGVGQEAKCVPDPLNSNVLIEQHFPARFSVQIYLICLSVLMSVSFLAFLLLWKTQPREKIKEELLQGPLITSPADNEQTQQKEEKFTGQTWICLGVILWTSILLIGCIPSINSYSLNPYGATTFHYVIIACQCCYPLVAFLSTPLRKYFRLSNLGIVILTSIGTLAFIYIFLTAYLSPCSPFVDRWFGKYLIGCLWLLVYLLFYFERICLGNWLNDASGHRGLFWYGLLTQLGAFSGATLIFTLTSFKLFQERNICVQYQC